MRLVANLYRSALNLYRGFGAKKKRAAICARAGGEARYTATVGGQVRFEANTNGVCC